MKVGARNRIVGRVTEIQKGKLMCLVKVEIPERSRGCSDFCHGLLGRAPGRAFQALLSGMSLPGTRAGQGSLSGTPRVANLLLRFKNLTG